MIRQGRWAFLLIACLLVTACEGLLVGDESDNTPVENFDLLWNEFDRLYGQFTVKEIDWEAHYSEYRSQVTPSMEEEDLWDVVTAMLRHLNDNHVTLHSPSLNWWFSAGILNDLTMEDFALDVLKSNYLTDVKTAGEGRFVYGWLEGNVGYVHIKDFLEMMEEPYLVGRRR